MEPTENFNDKEREMIKTIFSIIEAKGAVKRTALTQTLRKAIFNGQPF